MRLAAKSTAVGGLLAVAVLGASASWAVVSAEVGDEQKVRICHASGASSSPYTTDEIDRASVDATDSLFLEGHAGHVGPVFDPTANPPMEAWGDIIPPIESSTDAARNFPGLNWTVQGEAIWVNGCRVVGSTDAPSPTETDAAIPSPVDSDELLPAESVPVEIADPGALAIPEESDLVDPASPQQASVPTSVPAGGGAASNQG